MKGCKRKLIEKIAYDDNRKVFTLADADTLIPRFINAIKEVLVEDGEVNLYGLCKFYLDTQQARTGRNPATGELIEIPEKTVVRCHFTPGVKEMVKDIVLE